MCNSGTEACLSVLRLMRAHTGREKVRTELAGRGGRGREGKERHGEGRGRESKQPKNSMGTERRCGSGAEAGGGSGLQGGRGEWWERAPNIKTTQI